MKAVMEKLIIGVVVDILDMSSSRTFSAFGIGRVAAPTWDFLDLGSCKFVVLLPKVRLNNLSAARSLSMRCRLG